MCDMFIHSTQYYPKKAENVIEVKVYSSVTLRYILTNKERVVVSGQGWIVNEKNFL